MPVYSLEGTPGSGKSLYMVQKIIPDFIKHRAYDGSLMPRHIYTNIEGLKPELLCILCGLEPSEADSLAPYFHQLGEQVDAQGNKFEDKRYIRYFYYEAESIEWITAMDEKNKPVQIPNPEKAKLLPVNSLIIIDELQNYFGGRDFSTRYSKDCIDAITKNRHYGWSIWWASQSVESVDVTFRRNTQYVYFLEKLEIYGRSNSASVKIYEGWMSGEKTMVPPAAKKTFSYDKRFYSTYKSYIQSNVQEKRYKTNVFLSNKPLMIIVAIMIFCIGFTIINGNPLKKIAPSPKKPAQPAAQPPTLKGFSPNEGAQAASVSTSSATADEPRDSIVCIENSFTHAGIDYVIIDGTTMPKDREIHYGKCVKNNR